MARAPIALTFLGTGTSVGIPVVGCRCGVCTSADPRDKRLRASVLVELPSARVLVDAGPDLRTQCLRAGIADLDAALITHPHADHVCGFDDLRRFSIGADEVLPVYAPASCLAVLRRMYPYAFDGENRYPGYLKPEPRPVAGAFELGGARVCALPVDHGKVECVGYHFDAGPGSRVAYIPDCKRVSPAAMETLAGVDLLVIDALREAPHPTHQSFGEALDVARACGARRTWFTHIAHEVAHAAASRSLPGGVRIAHDGLKLLLP